VIPPGEQPGRERERFAVPRAPRAQPSGLAISLPSTTAPPGAEKIKIIVRAVRIEGSNVYRAEQLAALSQNLVGHEVTLTAVYDLARRITERYGDDGYVLSRAIVSVQETQ
jgi:hemolysin activation/secretion protein